MVSPKVLTPVSTFTAPVTTPATGQKADEAAWEATTQALLNRTEFNKDNAGAGPTLAVSQVWGRRSTGIAEGKASTDFSFDLLALASAVAHADATHTKGADIPSAGTTNIAAATGMFVHITGTTTITAFGTAGAGVARVLRFAAPLTLTHHATTLILPSAANIVTVADDVAVAISEGDGNWRVVIYQRASGGSVTGDASSLRGVNLSAGSIGAPVSGGMIYFDGVDYALTAASISDGVITATDGVGWGLIKNVNIDASAAIAGTKIDPDFGAQTIETTGDFTFGAAATAPTISQTAVVDVLGETLSLLGQSNNSATLKAGDLVLAPGANAGAGADGDMTLGLGSTGIEIGDAGEIGLHGATPVAKQTITGARNTQAAQADFFTDMATKGLITDSTTLQTAPGSAAITSNDLALDFSTFRHLATTLDANVTTMTVTDPPNIGEPIVIELKQAAASAFTVTWDGAFNFAGGTPPTMTATFNAVDVHVFIWNGAVYQPVAIQQDVS